MHSYGFVLNMPTMRADYLGLRPCCQEDIDAILTILSPGELEQIYEARSAEGPCLDRPGVKCGECRNIQVGAEYDYPKGGKPGHITICGCAPTFSLVIHELQHAAQCTVHGCAVDDPEEKSCRGALCAEIEAKICAARMRGGPCDDTSRHSFNKRECLREAWNLNVGSSCPRCIGKFSGDGEIGKLEPRFQVSCWAPRCAVFPKDRPPEE